MQHIKSKVKDPTFSKKKKCVCMYIYMYVCMYTHTHTHQSNSYISLHIILYQNACTGMQMLQTAGQN